MFWIDKINSFVKDRGLQIDPLPKIELLGEKV